MMVMVKYGLFEFLPIQTALSTFDFYMLLVATVLIAAGGNVINDLYDVDIDTINKPKKVIINNHISEKAANLYYIVLTSVGVIAGFYVANSVGKPGLAALFIGVTGLLYMYASQLKSKLLIGNIIVSFLVALSLLIIVLFDIFPAIKTAPSESQLQATQIIMYYALFAFYINFIREIVKDLQDINGDRKAGRNTLAIAIGRKRTSTVVFILGIVAIAGILVYMYLYLYTSQIAVLYFLFALLAPLLFFVIKAWNAENQKDYSFLSILLKIIMLLGVISMYVQKYILPNYA